MRRSANLKSSNPNLKGWTKNKTKQKNTKKTKTQTNNHKKVDEPRYSPIHSDTFRYISIHSFFLFFLVLPPPFRLGLLDFKLAVLLLCLLLLILLHPAPLPPDQVRFSFFRGCWFAFFVFYVSWAACVRLGGSGPGCMWGPWGSWGWPTTV